MHIMLDLETLDTGSRSVVTAIGAVAFDPAGDTLGDKFYVELTDDLATQTRAGRTISGDTVVWWMRQGQAAQQIFQPKTPEQAGVRVTTHDGLLMFTDFIRDHGDRDIQLWGNGADFDNIILGSLYEDLFLHKPWSYSRNRCFRTMKNLLPEARRPAMMGRHGVHHNALDDALTQARHLQAICAEITKG